MSAADNRNLYQECRDALLSMASPIEDIADRDTYRDNEKMSELRSSFLSVDPLFREALERAALREQWARRDWERHFAQRMSYNEYCYIRSLNAAVASGKICVARALDELANYRKENTPS